MKYILFYSFVIVDYLIIFYISGNIAAVFAFLIMGGILLKTIIQLRKNWIFFNIPDIDISFLPEKVDFFIEAPSRLKKTLDAKKRMEDFQKHSYTFFIFWIYIFLLLVFYDLAPKKSGGTFYSFYLTLLVLFVQVVVFFYQSIKISFLYRISPLKLWSKNNNEQKGILEHFLHTHPRSQLVLDDKTSCDFFCGNWNSIEDASIALNIAINAQITTVFYAKDEVLPFLDATNLSDCIFFPNELSSNPTFEELIALLKRYEWKQRYKNIEDIPKRLKLPLWFKSNKGK